MSRTHQKYLQFQAHINIYFICCFISAERKREREKESENSSSQFWLESNREGQKKKSCLTCLLGEGESACLWESFVKWFLHRFYNSFNGSSQFWLSF